MALIDFSRWDREALAAEWRAARPFPHLVIDGFLPNGKVAELRNAVAREPHAANADHFYEFMGSGQPMQEPLLLDFAQALASPEALATIAAISGKPVARCETRSYVYQAGSFLLPHADFHHRLDRLVAYAYYLLPREASVGGELELFDCVLEGEDVVETRSSKLIEPSGNRIVMFDVSPASLHQVREVTEGSRASLSGWFSGTGRPW